MRVRRAIVVGSVVGALLAWPIEAAADGGSYITFDQTHYLPGDTAQFSGYFAVPRARQDLLEQGPFYVYVVPPRAWLEEGKPLPAGVIRVGTATIVHEEATTFEMVAAFTVPDVSFGDYYNVQVCNDPCTIAGFREPLYGSISIVQTEREAQLLNEQQELSGKYWSIRGKYRKANRALEELETQLADSRGSVTELSFEVNRLQRADALPVTVRTTPSVSDDRPLVEAWALVAIAIAAFIALASIGIAMVFSRRNVPRLVVPDTIAELDEVTGELAVR